MSEAQELAGMLHTEGYTDNEIAQVAGVTREYINKIRSGKKIASASLTATLAEIAASLEDSYAGYAGTSTAAQYAQAEETEEGFIQATLAAVPSYIWVLIVLGILALAIIFFSVRGSMLSDEKPTTDATLDK